MSKYSEISNLDELNAAIHESSRAVAVREKQLKKRFVKARNFYTPSAFLVEGGKKLLGKLPFTDIALLLLRRLRGKR